MLGAGQTDAHGISIGVITTAAGTASGTVTLDEYSDGGSTDFAGLTPLGTSSVTVSGNVYRTAAAAVTAPASFIVHTGGTAAVSIGVANTAAADGFSEDLIAAVASGSASGGITPVATTTGDIAASGSGSIDLQVIPTIAGIFSGGVVLDMISDGTPIDGLGTLDLGDQAVQVTGTVYNYATAAVADIGLVGTLAGSGDSYTLNLGTVTQGAARAQAVLELRNNAVGLADSMTGSSAFSGQT